MLRPHITAATSDGSATRKVGPSHTRRSSGTAARTDRCLVSKGVSRWISPGAAATEQAVGYRATNRASPPASIAHWGPP